MRQKSVKNNNRNKEKNKQTPNGTHFEKLQKKLQANIALDECVECGVLSVQANPLESNPIPFQSTHCAAAVRPIFLRFSFFVSVFLHVFPRRANIHYGGARSPPSPSPSPNNALTFTGRGDGLWPMVPTTP